MKLAFRLAFHFRRPKTTDTCGADIEDYKMALVIGTYMFYLLLPFSSG